VPETEQDVVDVLTHDHREVEKMFAEIESLSGMRDGVLQQRRAELVDSVIMELVRHSVAEEAEVYPRVEKKISAEEAERARQEHAEAERTMKRLDDLDRDAPAFDEAFATLTREIREHVAEEEGEMFPRMRSMFSRAELIEMAEKVQRVKRVAPTRPHPSVPDQPPGNKVLGPVAGLFDRLRDYASGRAAADPE
jgi:hemerythrin superfamily protein